MVDKKTCQGFSYSIHSYLAVATMIVERCPTAGISLAPDQIASGATNKIRDLQAGEQTLFSALILRNQLISNINTCAAIEIALQVTCQDPPTLWATSGSYMLGGAPSISCGGISRPVRPEANHAPPISP
jgi:hypothetical protein